MNYYNANKNWEKIRTDAAMRLLKIVKSNLKNGELVMSDDSMADAIRVKQDTLKRVISHAKEIRVISTFWRGGLRVYTLYQPEQPKPTSIKLF